MTDVRKWCELCGEYVYPEDEVEIECADLDCPMSKISVGPRKEETMNWEPVADASGYLTPQYEEVWTKIDDDRGERNVAKLTRKGSLWFTEGGMYVYYTPTHWRNAEER